MFSSESLRCVNYELGAVDLQRNSNSRTHQRTYPCAKILNVFLLIFRFLSPIHLPVLVDSCQLCYHIVLLYASKAEVCLNTELFL